MSTFPWVPYFMFVPNKNIFQLFQVGFYISIICSNWQFNCSVIKTFSKSILLKNCFEFSLFSGINSANDLKILCLQPRIFQKFFKIIRKIFSHSKSEQFLKQIIKFLGSTFGMIYVSSSRNYCTLCFPEFSDVWRRRRKIQGYSL